MKMTIADIKKTAETKTFFDFIEMEKLVNEILGFDQRSAGKHYYPDTGNFSDWCDHMRYGQIDQTGTHRNSSRIWFAEYQLAIKDSEWKETPYLDFWHWQLDHCVNDNFQNDSYGWVNINPECAKDAEFWQKEIQQVWYNTFKDIADENGIIPIRICW